MKNEETTVEKKQEPAGGELSSEDKKSVARKSTRDIDGSIIKQVKEYRTAKGTRKKTIYYARIRYTDHDGRNREKKRLAESYNDAVVKRRQIQAEIEKELDPNYEVAEKPKTFNQVLDYFETEFVKAAVYKNGQKVEGYREDLNNLRREIGLFRKAFGKKLARRIGYDDIRRYKNERLAVPVKVVYFEKVLITDEERKELNINVRRKFKRVRKVKTKPREFASVNRELARLRRIFNIAIRQGWVEVNPFLKGEPLIQTSLETERLRICSLEEEKLLLASCTGRREHFKAILIFALDTGMRRSEIFRLCWQDVFLDERRVFVQATNSKTGRSRYVPITARVIEHLKALRKEEIPVGGTENDLDLTKRVFGITTNSGTAWENAIEDTGIEGLRFHDLRATAITRMLRAGMRESEVMKISGHTQYKTFLKYVRQDSQGTQSAADLMDSYINHITGTK